MMGWIALPEPGTAAGACKNPCEHTDCAATRQMAACLCPGCEQPLGHGRTFWIVDGTYTHVACTTSDGHVDHTYRPR